MAIQQTLADLRQRFYDRFDEGQSGYIDTAQANRLLNEGGRWLHNWIVSSSEQYIMRMYPLTVVTNQQDYPLPPDFFKDIKVFGVYVAQAGNIPYYFPLRRLMLNEYKGGPSTSFRYPDYLAPFGYLILGNILRISPIPINVNYNIEMWYAPHYQEMLNDGDTPDVSVAPGWDEFIINHAVIGAKLKEESSVADMVQRQAEIKKMIEEQIVNRDLGMPQRVTDLEYQNGGPNWFFGGSLW